MPFFAKKKNLQIFQSLYLSCGESLNHSTFMTLSHNYKPHTEDIFENIIYITKKTPKLVAKILATKFGFVPDCLLNWYKPPGSGGSAQLKWVKYLIPAWISNFIIIYIHYKVWDAIVLFHN